MITYEKIIETVSEIQENDLIYKKGLTLVYNLDEAVHKKLDEHFYYKIQPDNFIDDGSFEYTDEFEVNLGGVIVIFKRNE